MRYLVEVKHARRPKLLVDGNRILAWVDAPRVEGQANARLIALLGEHFGIAPSRIVIKRGTRSRTKLVEIDSSE